MRDCGFLEILYEPYTRLGIDMERDHVPVTEDRPTLDHVVSTGFEGVLIKECDGRGQIHCENPVEVRQ